VLSGGEEVGGVGEGRDGVRNVLTEGTRLHLSFP
jgi:hypothetical protein